MKKIIIAMIMLTSLLLATNAFALQQIAGPLVISVPMGGSGSAEYGLINDENETITISLRAEGDVAKYLSFPATVDLQQNKIVYTNITAKIPANYNVSLGKNITGFVYALQEGKPGQVKINIQLQKSVTITVVEQIKESKQTSLLTGFVTLVSGNSLLIASVAIVLLLFIVFMFSRIKKFGIEIKKNRR
jgi:hypothetical protein